MRYMNAEPQSCYLEDPYNGFTLYVCNYVLFFCFFHHLYHVEKAMMQLQHLHLGQTLLCIMDPLTVSLIGIVDVLMISINTIR